MRVLREIPHPTQSGAVAIVAGWLGGQIQKEFAAALTDEAIRKAAANAVNAQLTQQLRNFVHDGQYVVRRQGPLLPLSEEERLYSNLEALHADLREPQAAVVSQRRIPPICRTFHDYSTQASTTWQRCGDGSCSGCRSRPTATTLAWTSSSPLPRRSRLVACQTNDVDRRAPRSKRSAARRPVHLSSGCEGSHIEWKRQRQARPDAADSAL